MRKEINIVWLEDAINSPAHENRKEIVQYILADKGYEGKIFEKKNFNEAQIELQNNKRIDFFITDYNISDEEHTGLSYLKKIRSESGYKQFVILYSNNEHYIIKEDVKNILDKEAIDVFSNFTFFSLNDNNDETYFRHAIDVILCRWDELNAVRGRYMCENAEIEHFLREKLEEHNPDISYRTLVKRMERSLSAPTLRKKNVIFTKWLRIIDKRNALAHVREVYDPQRNCYFIQSLVQDKNEFRIYEDVLDNERTSLIELKKEIVKLIEGYKRDFI